MTHHKLRSLLDTYHKLRPYQDIDQNQVNALQLHEMESTAFQQQANLCFVKNFLSITRIISSYHYHRNFITNDF